MPAAAGCRTLCALATSAVLFLTCGAMSQTTYYVNGSCGDDSWTGLSPVCEGPNGPKATIQAGIDAADHFDTVVVADGVYAGEGNRSIQFREKELTLRSSGGPTKCIIDCEQAAVGIDFCNSPDDRPAVIEGLTIRNGSGFSAGGICIANADVIIRDCIIERCLGGGATFPAGGVLISGTSTVRILGSRIERNESERMGGGVTIVGGAIAEFDESTIQDNLAGSGVAPASGAGIYVDRDSVFHISRCLIADNRAPAEFSSGGGVFKIAHQDHRDVQCTIRSSTISGNVVGSSPEDLVAFGGGALLEGPVSIEECEIMGNTALSGGGLYIRSDSAFASDVVVSGNVARKSGGGVSFTGGSGASRFERVRVTENIAGQDGAGAMTWTGDLEWIACEFIANRAGRDGGGLLAVEEPRIANSLIADNEAAGRGGGVFSWQASNGLVNVTVVANRSEEGGGGLHVGEASVGGERTVLNSVVRGNSPQSVFDESGLLRIERSNVEGGWPGVGNLDVDARFVEPLAGDYRLRSGSPCIDSGDSRETVGRPFPSLIWMADCAEWMTPACLTPGSAVAMWWTWAATSSGGRLKSS